MINTYNESTLHEKLKNKYAELSNGKTEVELNGFFCDVVSGKEIYEIQTANLSSLASKISRLISDYSVTVVFPIAESTTIQWQTEAFEFISERKSPKKENEYRLFKEITKLLPFIDNPNFKIILLKAEILETRIKTDKPVQLKNNSRHWKKNWYKKDKDLLKINSELVFDSRSSYINLVRAITADRDFSLKQLQQNKACCKYAGLIIWTMKKFGEIEETARKGNEKFYRFVKQP